MPTPKVRPATVPLDPPTPVRAAIAAALEQFDARVAPRLREQGAELSAATRALAAALRHGTPRAIEEAQFALRRTMTTLGDECADERTELGALMLGVEYALRRERSPAKREGAGDPE